MKFRIEVDRGDNLAQVPAIEYEVSESNPDALDHLLDYIVDELMETDSIRQPELKDVLVVGGKFTVERVA